MKRYLNRRQVLKRGAALATGAALSGVPAVPFAGLPFPTQAEPYPAEMTEPVQPVVMDDDDDDDDGRWWASVGPCLYECKPYDDVDDWIFMRLAGGPLLNDALGRVIAAVVNRTQWIYQDALASAVMEMTGELAHAFGWESMGDDDEDRYASMDDCVKALQQPMTAAEVLSRLHRALDLVPPWYVTVAANPDFDWGSLDRTG